MTSLLMSSLPISTSHRLSRCRYSTSRDVVVSSPSSSRAPRRACSKARKTLLLKSTSINIFLLSMPETDISRYSWENLCSRLKWGSKSWVSAVSKQQFLQSSKRSKTFKRMCVVTRRRHSLFSLLFLQLILTSAVCGFLALLLANPKKQLEGQKLPSPSMNS